MMGAAVASATSLTANQRVAAELLNDSFFKMSPEASFLLRVSAVEALCPQPDQTDAFRSHRGRPANFDTDERAEFRSGSDRAGLEEAGKVRQSVRSAYRSKIKQLVGNDKAKKFDALYDRRSKFPSRRQRARDLGRRRRRCARYWIGAPACRHRAVGPHNGRRLSRSRVIRAIAEALNRAAQARLRARLRGHRVEAPRLVLSIRPC